MSRKPQILYTGEWDENFGLRFTLYPINGIHSQEDVDVFAGELRWKRQKVSTRIFWKRDGDALHMQSLPDAAIISHLKEEAGKREAYIQELEEALKKKQESEQLTPQERGEIKSTELYQRQKQEIKNLREKLRKLKIDNDRLMSKAIYAASELKKLDPDSE